MEEAGDQGVETPGPSGDAGGCAGFFCNVAGGISSGDPWLSVGYSAGGISVRGAAQTGGNTGVFRRSGWEVVMTLGEQNTKNRDSG